MQQSANWRTPFHFPPCFCSFGQLGTNSFIFLCFNFHIYKKKIISICSANKVFFFSNQRKKKHRWRGMILKYFIGKIPVQLWDFRVICDCFHSYNFAKQSKVEQKSARLAQIPSLGRDVSTIEQCWTECLASYLLLDCKECFISVKWNDRESNKTFPALNRTSEYKNRQNFVSNS